MRTRIPPSPTIRVTTPFVSLSVPSHPFNQTGVWFECGTLASLDRPADPGALPLRSLPDGQTSAVSPVSGDLSQLLLRTTRAAACQLSTAAMMWRPRRKESLSQRPRFVPRFWSSNLRARNQQGLPLKAFSLVVRGQYPVPGDAAVRVEPVHGPAVVGYEAKPIGDGPPGSDHAPGSQIDAVA